MKSKDVTTQMKALDEYLLMAVFTQNRVKKKKFLFGQCTKEPFCCCCALVVCCCCCCCLDRFLTTDKVPQLIYFYNVVTFTLYKRYTILVGNTKGQFILDEV